MGVDYSAGAGYTVPITYKELERMAEEGNHDCPRELLENMPHTLTYIELGDSSYTGGNPELHVIFQPGNLRNIDGKVNEWLLDVNEYFKTKFTIDDVKWVEGIHVY